MCAWTEMVMLKLARVDTLCRLTSHRTADFRVGTRLGKDDHIIKWMKPRKPRSIEQKVYDTLPAFLLVRECRVRIEQPGFRVRSLVIATTLLDAEEYTKDDLTRLYRARWNIELDWRSIKDVLQMDVVRCKTPELVRKEIWMHVLDYNLIHTVMAQAASQNGLSPRLDQFQGDASDPRSVSTDDCQPGSPRPSPPRSAVSQDAPSDRSALRR